MSNVRSNRVAEQMKKDLGEIINQKVKDPRIGFLTITDVDVTNDLQQAKVYVSVFGDEAEKEQTLLALDKASGFIRSEIGKRIRLKKTPEIAFLFDEAFEYGSKIDAILRGLNREDN